MDINSNTGVKTSPFIKVNEMFLKVGEHFICLSRYFFQINSWMSSPRQDNVCLVLKLSLEIRISWVILLKGSFVAIFS